jgi:predicted nucleic acid-binding protein
VIAATAMFTGSKLLTRNTRDFRNIPNRTVLKV